MEAVRKAQPDCFRFFLNTICNGVNANRTGEIKVSIEQLVRALTKEGLYAKTHATETVLNAIYDGLLVPVANSPGSTRGRFNDHKIVRLPELNEIMKSKYDYYCFECHLPGILEHCRQCIRSFHRLCYRKDAERPNYSVPSAKLQRNALPAFSSDTGTDSNEDEDDQITANSSTPIGYDSDIRASSSLLPLDQTSFNSGTPLRFIDEITVDSTSSPTQTMTVTYAADEMAISTTVEGKPIVEDPSETETKTSVDVVCLGEVRPATRKRPATNASSISYKSEVSPNEEEESDLELCTCCRLLKYAALRNPPNLEADELSHLIAFTFERNRSWIANDVLSYLDTIKIAPKYVELVNKLLFKTPNKHLDNIATKLRKKQYTFLSEFLVDILDLQHNMGVFFGHYSTDIESTKWLVRDIAHDLSEIRRCPDCFRYSHEKHSSVWFAKPCVQRHELVFAKHSGFSYWPAKVIRVLPNNKHDVRFFGGNHSRALIDARFIRPIDTDIKSLKMGNSSSIKKAMEELRYHQILSTYPPSKFSYHANKSETDQIIRNVLGRAMAPGGSSLAKKRGRKRKYNKETNNTPAIQNMDMPTQDQANKQTSPFIESEVEASTKRLRSSKSTPSSLAATKIIENEQQQLTQSLNTTNSAAVLKQARKNLKEALEIASAAKTKNEKLTVQIGKLKAEIKKQQLEKKIVKRKQWCYWCLNEAIYLCCFRAAYCSVECQSRHWKDGHSKVCKNHDDQRHATSTT